MIRFIGLFRAADKSDMLFKARNRVVLFGGTGMLGRAMRQTLATREATTETIDIPSDQADFRNPSIFDRVDRKSVV